MTNLKTLRRDMKESFEASLTQRVARAGRIRLQHFIPQHWFSAAASECVSMFVAGQFYGSISVSQAYIEALSSIYARTIESGY